MTEPMRADVFRRMNELNADLQAREEIDKVRAHVSASVSSNGIWSSNTALLDRPNSRFINVPHHITITVSGIAQKKAGVWISYPWDRKIRISTDMMAFCRGWETGSGSLTIESKSQPPYLDSNPTGSEEFVNFFLNQSLTAKVDAKVREALRNVQVGPTVSGLPSRCDALGYSSGDAGPNDDFILWQDQLSLNPVPDTITVKPLKIKRLAAHNLSGSALYDAVEFPLVDFWVGYNRTSFSVNGIVEGQEVLLASSPGVKIPTPANNSMLLIVGSMNYANNGLQDNAFQSFTSSVNFGAGTRTLVLNKMYSTIEPGQHPVKTYVPAYEITYSVTRTTPYVGPPSR